MKFFICNECDKVINLDTDDIELKCCNKKMEEINLSNEDNHVISLQRLGNFVNIKIDDGKHSMNNVHKIVFIIIETSEGYHKKYLNSEESLCDFILTSNEVLKRIWCYCNLHGLFMMEL